MTAAAHTAFAKFVYTNLEAAHGTYRRAVELTCDQLRLFGVPEANLTELAEQFKMDHGIV